MSIILCLADVETEFPVQGHAYVKPKTSLTGSQLNESSGRQSCVCQYKKQDIFFVIHNSSIWGGDLHTKMSRDPYLPSLLQESC